MFWFLSLLIIVWVWWFLVGKNWFLRFILRFCCWSALCIVVNGTRVMAQISGHFSDNCRNDCGVKSSHKLYFSFLYCLVQIFLLFVCRFIVIYPLITRIEKISNSRWVAIEWWCSCFEQSDTEKRKISQKHLIFFLNIEFYALLIDTDKKFLVPLIMFLKIHMARDLRENCTTWKIIYLK